MFFFISSTGCTASSIIQPSAVFETAEPNSITLTPIRTNTALPTLTRPTLTLTPRPTKTLYPTWSPPSPTEDPALAEYTNPNQIRTMLIDRNGDLWTGGMGGAVHWNLKTGGSTIYTAKDGLGNNYVVTMAQTADGAYWFGTLGGGIARFNGVSWQRFTKQTGLPSDYIASLVRTADDRLWVDTSRYPPDGSRGYFGRFSNGQWIPENGVGADRIAVTPDGVIWAIWSSDFPDRVGELTYYNEHKKEWSPSIQLDGFANNPALTDLAISSSGSVWVTTHTEVFRYQDHQWQTIHPIWEKNPHSTIVAMTFQREDTAWFGFSMYGNSSFDPCGVPGELPSEYGIGVYRYNSGGWRHFTSDDGLIDNKICAMIVGPDDSVWFGSFDRGVSRFDGKTWSSWVVPDRTKR